MHASDTESARLVHVTSATLRRKSSRGGRETKGSKAHGIIKKVAAELKRNRPGKRGDKAVARSYNPGRNAEKKGRSNNEARTTTG